MGADGVGGIPRFAALGVAGWVEEGAGWSRDERVSAAE